MKDKLDFNEVWDIINYPVWGKVWGQLDGQIDDQTKYWVDVQIRDQVNGQVSEMRVIDV